MKQQRWNDSEKRREEKRRNKIREEKGPEERRQKGRKFSTRSVFPMFCGSGGSKSMLAKAAGAEPSWERSAEKLHAVVGRSTFGSQHVQNTPCSEHFWKLRCEKSARCCGAKRAKSSYSYSYNHNYHYTAATTTTTTTTALRDTTLHDYNYHYTATITATTTATITNYTTLHYVTLHDAT